MEKTVRVVDYVRNMTDAMASCIHVKKEESIPINCINAQALIFLKTFGSDYCKSLVEAFNKEGTNFCGDCYQVFFLLLKKMTKEDVNAFISALDDYNGL